MRTYAHALLTAAVARRLASPGHATVAALGATLPDFPIALGAAWLLARRSSPLGREELDAEVCSRTVFRGPDAALHSALPVGAALAACVAVGLSRGSTGAPLAFLLGWSGHALADALTHADDARPLLWPLSDRRFRGPVSYWDRGRHGRTFSFLEHASLVPAALDLLHRRDRRR